MRRSAWIICTVNWSAYHNVTRAAFKGLADGNNALLVVTGAAGGSDARGYNEQLVVGRLTQHFGFVTRSDDAVTTAFLSILSSGQYEISHFAIVAK